MITTAPTAKEMLARRIKRCENCGRRSNVSCDKCLRPICDECYPCGSIGKVCGLCLDRENDPED